MYHTELSEEQRAIIGIVLSEGEKEVVTGKYDGKHSYHFGFDIILTLLIALPEIPPETIFDFIGENWIQESVVSKRLEWQEVIIKNIEKLKG